MNKLGIFMNFWEKGWAADHKKYIKKAAEIGFDILEFQAQPLLEMTDDHIRDLRKTADEYGIELTYSLGLDRRYDVSSLDESIRKGGITYLQNIIRKMAIDHALGYESTKQMHSIGGDVLPHQVGLF